MIIKCIWAKTLIIGWFPNLEKVMDNGRSTVSGNPEVALARTEAPFLAPVRRLLGFQCARLLVPFAFFLL